MSPEPQTPEELFAPPCAECAQAARGMVIGAVVAGALVGAGLAWLVFGRK